MVMVRTSRFSCSIILFVSFTSKIFIMSVLLCIRFIKVLDSVHYIENIFMLAADHYTDLVADFRKFL